MNHRTTWILATFAVLAASSVAAQSDDGALRDRLRQVTLQLRQLQDDQAALQAQKAAAEAERDAAKKQVTALQSELARSRHQGDRAAAAEQDLAKTKDALNQASEAVKSNQTERDKLAASLAGTGSVLEACRAKNAQLLKVGHEILKAYEQFDVGDAIGANEPFTRLERVQLENLAQDYGDRIEDGRFDARAAHAAQQSVPPDGGH